MTTLLIPPQTRLPLRMAAAVVAQGIRIRLGRSLVTVTGIALGIAFLASILASQALRRGLAEEDRLREEASRMFGFLVAETGSLRGRSVALVSSGQPSEAELRLLQRLEREKVAEVRVWPGAHPLPPGAFSRLTPRVTSDAAALLKGAACLIRVGPGQLPPALRDAKQVELEREPSAEERERRARSLERERFRGLWIIGISLLVTVIGITNALLMSVTERFRDIGTMKCLGATSRFIRQIFLLEASFMGLVGGAAGVVLGIGVALVTDLAIYDARLVAHVIQGQLVALGLGAAESLLAAVVLSVVAALYPARFAARMVPADALRSHV